MSKFGFNLFPAGNRLREFSRVPTSSSRDIENSILMVDPIEHIVSTGTFREINRLTPQQKVSHIPEIVRRFDLVMPDRTIFQNPVDMWQEIVKQYSYKHLSEVPLHSNLMTPEAYFIKSVHDGDIVAFERFNAEYGIEKLDGEFIELALERFEFSDVNLSRFTIGLKLLSYMDIDELEKMLDYASKIGDLTNFDLISEYYTNFDNIEQYLNSQVEFLVRDGHIQKAISISKKIIDDTTSVINNTKFNYKDIHDVEDPSETTYDLSDPEFRAEILLERIQDLHSTNPIILEIIERTQFVLDFKEITKSQLDDTRNYIRQNFDFHTLNANEKYLVTEYMKYIGYSINMIEKEMIKQNDYMFYKLIELHQIALQYDNLEYFQFLWAQRYLIENQDFLQEFMNFVSFYAAGENFDPDPIKTKIFRFIDNERFLSADQYLSTDIIKTIRRNDFDYFQALLNAYKRPGTIHGSIDNLEGIVSVALQQEDVRYIEYLHETEEIEQEVGEVIENFQQKYFISFAVIEYIKTRTNFTHFDLFLSQALHMVRDTDIVKILNLYHQLQRDINVGDVYILKVYLKSNMYKFDPEILMAILATPFFQKQLTGHQVSQLISSRFLDPIVIKTLLNITPDPVTISSDLIEQTAVFDLDRDFYIYLLELIKWGKIRILKEDLPKMAKISDKLYDNGFIEMANLTNIVMRGGATAKL